MRNSERNTGISRCPSTLIIKRIYSNGETKDYPGIGAKQLPLSKEEQIFQAARDLAAEIGISYSEALGFTLGIKDVTYGWEEDYTEEEFQALIDHAVGDTDYEHTLY